MGKTMGILENLWKTVENYGKIKENHRKTIGKWWFNWI